MSLIDMPVEKKNWVVGVVTLNNPLAPHLYPNSALDSLRTAPLYTEQEARALVAVLNLRYAAADEQKYEAYAGVYIDYPQSEFDPDWASKIKAEENL